MGRPKPPGRGRWKLQTPRRNSLLWSASLEKAKLWGLPTLCSPCLARQSYTLLFHRETFIITRERGRETFSSTKRDLSIPEWSPRTPPQRGYTHTSVNALIQTSGNHGGRAGSTEEKIKSDPLAETCSGSESGSYLRLIDSCITQLKAQGPFKTCNESKEEEAEGHRGGSGRRAELGEGRGRGAQ